MACWGKLEYVFAIYNLRWIESEKYKGVADKWFGISEQLEGKLRNGEVLTVDEGRQLEDGVVEAMSTLFRSGMVSDAMSPEGNLPGWMRPVISACAEASTHAPEYAVIGDALRELEAGAKESPDGAKRYQEAVNKLMQNHRDVLERMFEEYREEPTAEQIARMEEEVQRAQDEQDARVGRGRSIVPEETEARIEEARQEAAEEAEAQAAEEAEAQEEEAAARQDIQELPGNEGMSEEEVTKERARSFAEAQEDKIANDPAVQEDAAGIFAGGKYTPVQAEGFGDVKAGMVPVGLISLGTEGTPRGANYEGMRIGSDAHYRPNHEPIYLWQRANGELVVIDGHNRLLRAKLAGADSINAYVFTETAERNEQWARAKYYEKNVREHKASVKEVAWFVSGANIHGRQLTAEELAEYGLNEEQSNKVRIGIMLGRYGAPEVLDALFDRPGEYEFEEDVLGRGGISLADAVRIVEFAKGDRDVQLEGLRALRGEADENGVYGQGRNIEAARRVMQLFLESKGRLDEVGEVEAERERHFLRWLADYQGRKLKDIEGDIALLREQGLTKELVEKYGIDRQQGGNEGALKKLRNEMGMWRMLSVGDWESDRLREVREAYEQEFGGEDEVKQRYVEDTLATMQSYKRSLKTPNLINSIPEEKIKEYHGATKKMKYAGARAEVHEWLNEMRAKYARKAAAWRKAYKAMHEEKDWDKRGEAQRKLIELGKPLLEEARARGYIWEYGDPSVGKQTGDARVGAYIAGAVMGDRKLHFEAQLWEFANYKGRKPGLKKKYDDAFFAKWTTEGIDESMKMLKNPDAYERERLDNEYKKSKREFFENYAEEKVKELQGEEERLSNEGTEEAGRAEAEETLRRQQEMWQHPGEHEELLDEVQWAYGEETGEQMWLNEGVNEAGERVRNVHFSTEENQKADNGLLGKAWEDAREGKETERPNLRRCYARNKAGARLGRDVLIRTPQGNLNWFEFPKDEHTQEVLEKKGIKDLPIRLKIGVHQAEHQGYGWMHVLNHYNDMQAAGESPLLFLYNTLTNLTRMDGRGGARYTFGAQKSYNENRALVVDLMEDEGCYSIVTCYPTSAPNQYAGSGLLVGRALFRLSDSNSQNRMESRHRTNEVATGTGGTNGKAKAEGNLTQEAPSVNIYDVEVVNEKKQLVYSQPQEPRAHFSLGGERAATYGEMEAAGLAYYDPADGKRKFALPTAGVRLRGGFTPGELNVGKGGHKDVSLAALLHYPELFRAYPELGRMRVRLYREEGSGVGGFYAPGGILPKEGSYIALNMGYGTDPGRILDTLLHESQHAIQSHEGWAMGYGGMSREQALEYLGRAIELRKKLGTRTPWGHANMRLLKEMVKQVRKAEEGDELRHWLSEVYWMSHGEQEARYAGERRTDVNGEGAPRVSGVAEGYDTIAVLPEKVTELGGITFGNAGIYARLMESRLAPVGDFQTDRRLYQIRESAVRYARLLNGFTKEEDKAGESLLLEAQGVAERAVSLLPNEYRVGLEPYRVWLSVFAKLSSGGVQNAAEAARMVPMKRWQEIMAQSFIKQMRDVFAGRVNESDMEFWLGRERSRRVYEEARGMYERAHEQAAAEMGGAAEKALRERAEEILLNTAGFRELRDAVLGEMGKVKTERVLAKLLERVKHQLDAYRKDKTLGAMRKAVAAAYPAPGKGGKPVKGKMNADSYRALEDYMALLELTEGEQAMFERERYTGEGKEKAWADLEDGDLVTVDVWNEDGEKRVITCTKMEYETYACYERMTPEQAEAAARALGEFITTGRQAWENKQEVQKREIAGWCRDILDEFDTSENARRAEAVRNEGVMPGRRWFLNLTSWTMNPAQIFDVLAHVPGLQTFARHVGSRIERAEVQLQEWDKERLYRTAEIMRQECGVKSKKELRAFIDDMNLTRESGIELTPQAPDFERQESEVLRRQFLGLLHRKMRQKNFNANTFAAAFEELVKDELMPEHIAEEARAKYGAVGDAEKARLKGKKAVMSLLTERELEKFYDLRKETAKRAKEAEEKWLKEKEEKREKLEESGGKMRRSHGGEVLQMTKGEAAYRVLLAEQPAYTEMLRQQGYTEEVVQQLREFAGEKVMNLAYALRAELAKRTPEMKALYEKVYGMPFPEEENYFRAFFDVGQETEQRTLGERAEGKASGGGKILSDTITFTNTKTIDFTIYTRKVSSFSLFV